MEIISSRENKKVKEARKLLTKKYRQQSYLIEGFHLFDEAVKTGARLISVFVSADKVDRVSDNLQDAELIVVTDDVLKSLSDAETPQGIIAEVAKSSDTADFAGDKFLVLENVQDPGNVGTMVRTADAAGFSAVFVVGDTADIYSPKVVRSMQGSHFHLPVIKIAERELFDSLKTASIPILTTTLSTKSVSYKSVKNPRFALVMGNEGNGVSELALEQADTLVHIEMPGQAESLNVAVAAGILMFSL
ncbi:TrmH family RNA methyltransferase [Lactococcus nasutitermitis]|uniref:TrmH family RNA methyltransferase n=1 Tax=Lactococcus nasutitermitis TaxID=1652957 RepID=A0ABV9JDF9_9LACT|nr:RNA methyltransferase [Lactococcus nasutitermitis]